MVTNEEDPVKDTGNNFFFFFREVSTKLKIPHYNIKHHPLLLWDLFNPLEEITDTMTYWNIFIKNRDTKQGWHFTPIIINDADQMS